MDVPGPDRLLALVDRLSGPRVGMVVDLVADRFLFGLPKRISREAPVLILRQESDVWIPGGGANAVANVAALGGRPRVLGVVGADEPGERILALLAERGVDTSGILRLEGHRTTTKTRILAGPRHGVKQQVVRIDVEDELELADAHRNALAENLRSAAEELDGLILSDYGSGLVDDALIATAREVGTPTLADSRYRLAAFAGVDGATPNEEEAEALWGGPLGEGPALARAGATLRERLALDFLLVTRGSAGMALFTGTGTAELPVHGSAQVADVTGAGDTVIGSFSLALAAGATPLEAAVVATYAAGIVVQKHGTATASPDELRVAVDRDPDLSGRIREIG